MPNLAPDDWGEYRRLILSELERLSRSVQDLTVQVIQMRETGFSEIRSEISVLKVKAGVWGLMGGLIPVVVVILLSFLKFR